MPGGLRGPRGGRGRPGHDGWVVGDEAAVLVQYDCGADTVERLGLPASHGHDA